MAKISVEIDTNDKSMVVKINGSVVENVTDVRAYQDHDYDYFGCDVCTMVTSKDDGLRTYTRYCSAESKDGEHAKKNGQPVAAFSHEFIKASEKSSIEEEISRYISGN
jgi:hypothetical protein